MSMTAYDTLVSMRTRTSYALVRKRETDTRPSGERESGSYSGTRQRNRIQFGPS